MICRPLPSSDSAHAFVHGEGKAGPLVVHTLGRAALLGVGLYLAGARGRDLVKYAAAGAAVIEVFALLWFAQQEPCE